MPPDNVSHVSGTGPGVGGASSSSANPVSSGVGPGPTNNPFELRLKDLKEILLTFEENKQNLTNPDYSNWVIEQDRHLVRCFYEYLRKDDANMRVCAVMLRIMHCLSEQYPRTRCYDPLLLGVLKKIAMTQPKSDFRNRQGVRLGCLAVATSVVFGVVFDGVIMCVEVQLQLQGGGSAITRICCRGCTSRYYVYGCSSVV